MFVLIYRTDGGTTKVKQTDADQWKILGLIYWCASCGGYHFADDDHLAMAANASNN